MKRKLARANVKVAQRGKPLEKYVASRKRVANRRVRASLDGGERLTIINTFRTILEGAYCHLPQKRAGYAFDPVQALQLLELRASDLSEAEFHLQMTSIITGLRDAHTRYSGPRSLQNSVAVLPFLVEQCGSFSQPTFLVSKVSKSRLIKDKQFARRCRTREVEWNPHCACGGFVCRPGDRWAPGREARSSPGIPHVS